MAVEYLLVPAITGTQSVRAISAAVGAVTGVRLVTVSIADKRVRVEHDRRTSLAALIKAIEDAGYTPVAVLS
ncbi:MAG: heavy-metal-associated domain-containing protein [Kouleothrix sp.]|jgi:copper chaperone CopZ|nr:heavy-metal-associated domain-containing protein [Kouleothrix sp.]